MKQHKTLFDCLPFDLIAQVANDALQHGRECSGTELQVIQSVCGGDARAFTSIAPIFCRELTVGKPRRDKYLQGRIYLPCSSEPSYNEFALPTIGSNVTTLHVNTMSDAALVDVIRVTEMIAEHCTSVSVLFVRYVSPDDLNLIFFLRRFLATRGSSITFLNITCESFAGQIMTRYLDEIISTCVNVRVLHIGAQSSRIPLTQFQRLWSIIGNRLEELSFCCNFADNWSTLVQCLLDNCSKLRIVDLDGYSFVKDTHAVQLYALLLQKLPVLQTVDITPFDLQSTKQIIATHPNSLLSYVVTSKSNTAKLNWAAPHITQLTISSLPPSDIEFNLFTKLTRLNYETRQNTNIPTFTNTKLQVLVIKNLHLRVTAQVLRALTFGSTQLRSIFIAGRSVDCLTQISDLINRNEQLCDITIGETDVSPEFDLIERLRDWVAVLSECSNLKRLKLRIRHGYCLHLDCPTTISNRARVVTRPLTCRGIDCDVKIACLQDIL